MLLTLTLVQMIFVCVLKGTEALDKEAGEGGEVKEGLSQRM